MKTYVVTLIHGPYDGNMWIVVANSPAHAILLIKQGDVLSDADAKDCQITEVDTSTPGIVDSAVWQG